MDEFVWLRVSPTRWIRCSSMRRVMFGGAIVILWSGEEVQAVNPRQAGGAIFFDERSN